MVEKRKSVLVVDDEVAVRDLVQAILRHVGHLVETAAGGTEALTKIDALQFDLVFTDLIMPGMKGDELAREIKKRKPNLPIVLLTGHTPDVVSADFSMVMGKPFTRDQLCQTISALT